MEEIKTEQLKKEQILDILIRSDSSFKPVPLSQKVNLIEYADKLAKYATHFICVRDNIIIGFSGVYLNSAPPIHAFISVTVIDPKYQKMGIGQKITDLIEKIAKEAGFQYIEFEVDVNNIPSIEMHKKIGYYISEKNNNSYFMNKKINEY